MTDSVRCSADSPNAFTCEVELDSNFETLTCEAPDPPPPLPPPNPAVSSLVSSFVSRTVVAAPSTPLISGAALLSCASSELSLVLAAVGGKSPIATGLTMLKAAIDAGTCLTLAHDRAAQRSAQNYCAAQGGVVTGIDGDKTLCEVRETEK